MGRFYQALQRADAESTTLVDTAHLCATARRTAAVPMPAVEGIFFDIAREASIRQFSERLLARSGHPPITLIVSGCGPGDGASSIAAALSIDITQRLGARTLLVDAHFRHPSIQRLLARPDAGLEPAAVRENGRRASRWPRLDLLSAPAAERAQLAGEIDGAASDYAVRVVDAGVIRLDPAILNFINGNAPVLLVARYGHTERRQLISTVEAVRAAGRTAIGVAFNAVDSMLPAAIRRIFEAGE